MATLRERSPGVWLVRVYTGKDERGRPTQVARTFRGTKKAAEKFAASLEVRAPARTGGRTVKDALDAWFEANEPVWAEASKRDYRGRIAKISADQIARVPLAVLGVADVERWHARMRTAGVGPSAVRCRHVALRAALGLAVRWEWMVANPAANARLRQAKQSPRTAMSADDVRAVIAAAEGIDPAAGVALRLAALAGLRRSELAALRWDDIDGDRLTIDSSVETRRLEGAEPEYVDAPTKTANRRTVRLDAATLDALGELRSLRGEVSPYLFSIDNCPAPPARIGWWWSRARTNAGIDKAWRLHDLRHWSATMAIAGGHDVRTVAGRLGHASAAMTLRVYAHAVDAADEALANDLASVLDAQDAS